MKLEQEEKSAENLRRKDYFKVEIYSERAAISSSLRGFEMGFIIAEVLNLSKVPALYPFRLSVILSFESVFSAGTLFRYTFSAFGP